MVEWESPREAPIQHSHIDQCARLPENCPACAKMWADVCRYFPDKDPELDLAQEFEFARNLLVDWDEETMHTHLTQLRDRALIAKWNRTKD